MLIKRRDTIGRAYLTAINPIVDPRLDAAGALTFENAAVAAGVARGAGRPIAPSWSRFDNATGETAADRRDAEPTTDVAGSAGRTAAGRGRQLRRDRHRRREREPPVVAAAGAHVLPPHERRLEAGRASSGCLTGRRRAPAAGATAQKER